MVNQEGFNGVAFGIMLMGSSLVYWLLIQVLDWLDKHDKT